SARVQRGVLIVDDDSDVRGALRELLCDEGYPVREAADGAEAFAELQKFPACLMLLDLFMPNLDGVGLLDKLDATPKVRKPPVVMITAAPTKAPRDRVHSVLAKPFDFGELLRTVERLCPR